jgi:X-Pro dipeptidyl-peptidase
LGLQFSTTMNQVASLIRPSNVSYISLFLSVLFVLGAVEGQAQANKSDYKGASPVFKNGEAQVVAAFRNSENWIKEELWVETSFDSDNDSKLDRMHVFVTRPIQTNDGLRLPVIYMTSPYYGLKLKDYLFGNKKKYFWNVKHELGEQPKPHKHPNRKTREKRPFLAGMYDRDWVPRGYIMVYSSSPGTGLSDGAPTIGGENESLAPKAVIDWLCGRAKGYKTRTGNEEVTAFWSTKKVGMTGTSYDGTLCLAAATTGVEGLEAIIPVAPIASYYEYYRSNGLVRSPGGYMGEDMDVLYDFINTGDKAKRAANNARIRDSMLVKNIDRVTGDYNAFWDGRNYLNKMENLDVALLMAHGFNDWNVMTSHSYQFYKAATEKGLPTQYFCHQNGHGGDPPLYMMNRWFTRYLHGIENSVEEDDPVQLVREHKYTPTSYANYPNADATAITLYLKGGTSQLGELTLEKPEAQSNQHYTDNFRVKGEKLVEEKHADHRLLYVSPILDEAIHLSGTARVSVTLSSSKPSANLSVWLVSLPWQKGKGVKIYDNVITRGWADPKNYKSLEKEEELLPGEFYKVAFDLMPDDQIIPKGQQIGLMIFSSDKEFTLHPKPGTVLTINPTETTLTLPIVGGIEGYKKATSQ